MTSITYREGQDCPAECGDLLIRCHCDDSGSSDGHLICLGCGEDAGCCDCTTPDENGSPEVES